jgi:DNA-binding SARP family transcriptional activator
MSGLSVHLFGRFSAQRDDQVVNGLESQRVQALFAYLLLYRNRALSREALAEVLWGETATGQSRKYLRQALWQLQGCLDRPEQGSQVGLLVVDPEWIRLDEGADLWLDVAELEKAAALTHGIPSDSLPPESVRALQNAVELYQGNLLESCYADWCLFERERLQSMYLAMLDKLMGCCEARHEYETGTLYGERILRCDRARERAHRRLMRLLYLAGDRSAALRQYERCSAILEEELGVKPARSTLALYDQIRNDRLEPTAAQHEDRTGQAQPGWDAPAWPNLSGDLEQLQKALREIERSIQQGIHLVDRALKEAG